MPDSASSVAFYFDGPACIPKVRFAFFMTTSRIAIFSSVDMNWLEINGQIARARACPKVSLNRRLSTSDSREASRLFPILARLQFQVSYDRSSLGTMC